MTQHNEIEAYDEISPEVVSLGWKAEGAVRYWLLQRGGFEAIAARDRQCEEDSGNGGGAIVEGVLMEGLQYLLEQGLITITDPPPANPAPVRKWAEKSR